MNSLLRGRFKSVFPVGTLAIVLASVAVARAGLQIPYTPNADTLHLWHFDEASGVLAADAVVGSGITLTNSGLPAGGPFTNISLGDASFAGLGNALGISQRNAFANGGSFADTTPFLNPTSGAFTFEALIRPSVNPLAPPNNMAIIYGDNQAGPRAWQFRIRTDGRLELNTITPGGQTYLLNLPSSGLNAALPNQWYHVAISYTGDAPTNSDPAGVLRFYWTLLDANRTAADQLGPDQSMGLRPGGAPVIAVGGSGRTQSGVGNGEGFLGLIDEVRISSVALNSNEMAFAVGGALNPPEFTQQPPTNVLVAFGKTLSLPTLVSGTLPIDYQWQQDSGTGFTNKTDQTESSLLISNVNFSAAGQYRLIATNAYGNATSVVAQVTVGAAPSGLFNTGVDADGVLLSATTPGSPDLHYQMIRSADGANLGPNTIIWSDLAPLAPNGVFAANGPLSGWIGPQQNTGQVLGEYRYRTSFVIDSADPATVTLNGGWWLNSAGLGILLNGVATGITDFIDTPEKFSSSFTISSGFVAGSNTLVFVVTNGNGNFSGVRVEMTAVGEALPPGLPVINSEPADSIVRDAANGGGSRASFAVVALGRPPLSYQWWSGAAPVTDATNRTLTFVDPTAGAQGTSFRVVVSNDSGSVTSRVAALTLTSTNHLPVPPTLNITTVSNTPVNIYISDIINGSTDADMDIVSLLSADTLSTNGATDGGANGGTVVQDTAFLVYTPRTDYVGQDQFSFAVNDAFTSEYPTGVVNIIVTTASQPPQSQPGFSTVSISGDNLIFSGTNAPVAGSYVLLSSTNAATPLIQWTPEATNTWDGTGNFSVTNPITAGAPQKFYLLQLQ